MARHSLEKTLAAVVTSWLVAGTALAAPPLLMPVQGVLRDNAGAPVADGAFSLTFSLYAAESDPTPVWTETWPPASGDCANSPAGCVAVQGGVFSVLLGTHEPLDPQVFASAAELWLGVKVEADPELPRRRLGSTAYALHAASAGTAGDLACSGCVGMGALADDVKAALAKGGTVTPDALPSDGLDEVSNGTLTNHYAITANSADTPKTVPGFWFEYTDSKLLVPDLGISTSFQVTVNIAHPLPDQLVVVLTPPAGLGAPVTLHDLGPGTAGGLSGTYPVDLTPAAGSLDPWVGVNPAGEWTLGVKDELAPGGDGTIQAWSISFDYLTSKVVKATGDLDVAGDVAVGGSVTCAGCIGEAALAPGIRFPGVLVASTGISGCSGNGSWSKSYTVPEGAKYALVYATGGTGAQGQACGLNGVLVPAGGSLWCRDTGNVSQSITFSLSWGSCSGSYVGSYGSSINGTVLWYK